MTLTVTDQTYWICFGASNGLLLIFWIILTQQFCVTDNFKEKLRLRRLLLCMVNLTLFLFLNSLSYLSTLYPHHTLFSSTLNVRSVWIIIQGITAIIGFHTFRLLFIYVIDVIYNSSSVRAPKKLSYFLNVMEVLIIILILVCHLAAIISNKAQFWMYLFYLIFGVHLEILIGFLLYLLKKPLKLLRDVTKRHRSNPDKSKSQQLAAAIAKVQGAYTTAIIVSLAALVDIVFTSCKLLGVGHWFNFEFLVDIMRSAILVFLSFALFLWMYRPSKGCCRVPANSVCDVYCCSWCDDDMEDFQGISRHNTGKDFNNLNVGILMDDTHSINGKSNVTVTTMNDSTLNTKI